MAKTFKGNERKIEKSTSSNLILTNLCALIGGLCCHRSISAQLEEKTASTAKQATGLCENEIDMFIVINPECIKL